MSATTAATQWVYDFAEGSRDMRDLLGGKGANVAEMTRVLGAERVPAGLHDHDRGLRRLHAGRPARPRRARRAGRRGARPPGGAGRPPARRPERPAARLGPLGRARVDAGHARHRPEPRAQRRVRRRPGREDRQRALRVGLLPALRADVRQRRARRRGRALRGRDQGGQAGARRARSTPSSTSTRCASWSRTFQGFYDVPRRSAGAAARGHHGGLRLVDGRPRGRVPAHQPDPRRVGHRGQRPADGVRQQGRHVRLRGRLQPRRGHRRARAVRRLPGQRPGRGRRLAACATPRTSPSCASSCPRCTRELMDILRTLERHYDDMQDTEFTVEEGRLYMLQTRSAKRPAQAAVRFAVDAVAEGLLDKAQAIATIDAENLDALLHPTFDPHADFEVLARGVAASPGRGEGRDRLHRRRRGRGRRATAATSILVRPFTEADDVAGFHAAKGILTSEGGKASHAALVARGMGVPAVTGASDAGDRRRGRRAAHGDDTLRAGDRIAIDGTTGAMTTARRAARRAEDGRALRAGPGLVRRAAPARRARERGHARRTRGGPASSARRGSACAAPSTCSSATSATSRWCR